MEEVQGHTQQIKSQPRIDEIKSQKKKEKEKGKGKEGGEGEKRGGKQKLDPI